MRRTGLFLGSLIGSPTLTTYCVAGPSIGHQKKETADNICVAHEMGVKTQKETTISLSSRYVSGIFTVSSKEDNRNQLPLFFVMNLRDSTNNESTKHSDQSSVVGKKREKMPENADVLTDFPPNLNFCKMEEETEAYWKKIDAFQTSMKKSEGKKAFTFYDGPPFATGMPHYGHLLAGTIKDIVCRFAHQTGHHVERRFGWDCHGLPIEFEIEKELGIKSSQDVMKFGIDNYNKECRKIVMRYSGEWEKIMGRAGRWINFENGYKTMNIEFMESVWWVFGELWKKELVYRGYKVMPFSTACTTPLSNFEANMNYKDAKDISATVTFPLIEDPTLELLAWTTTPWTLPSNLALVVNSDFDYITVNDVASGKKYIFAECRLSEVYKNHEKAKVKPFTIISKCKGKDLVGKRYKPLFTYFSENGPKIFTVLSDPYVSSESGTGIVHSAPGFGEDDYRICLDKGIIEKGQTVCPVDENGCFTSEVSDFTGRYIKDCDNDILNILKKDGRLYMKSSITHSYPFCWRSDTPLIYKAVSAWFVRVESIREEILESNRSTTWVPDIIKTKRFTNWLQDAKDWNVSRNRYWGTPLPIWHSEDMEEIVVISSIKQLEELSGVTGITDIHREFVDKITIPSKRPGMAPLKRVTEVFDCWFESGSMPYAQAHYPFENQSKFESNFPADFIAEGLDQTRGWFYTLMVLSTALFGKAPFKNLIVNGLVLAEDGKKMSKRLNNYPDLMTVINEYGADALRLYLINSPVVRGEPLRFRQDGVKDVIKDVFLPLFNACKFFISNCNLFLKAKKGVMILDHQSPNDMDRWIISASQTLVNCVHVEMENYRLYTVVPRILHFIEELTNWYVRMNRNRLKGQAGDEEQKHSLCTLFHVLFLTSRILAPFSPFVAEAIFQRIRPILPKAFQEEDSIHYIMVPDVVKKTDAENRLEQSMGRMIKVVELIRVLRDRIGIPMKMPVKSVIVLHSDEQFIEDIKAVSGYISTEVNAFDLEVSSAENDYVITKLDGNMATIGKKFGKEGGAIKKALVDCTAEEIASIRHKMASGEPITIAGKDIVAEDIKILRTFREGMTDFESNTDGQVVVLVDKRQDEALMDSWKAREFVNRVMQLRKTAKLVITDAVDVFYETADETLEKSLVARASQINEKIPRWFTKAKMHENAEITATVETQIADSNIKIMFTKHE
eukprot:Tbor_TRINITY_DN3022_c0_g1::TRINITY_DN3022_c0_g1_i1::g.17437::m.17437/K01870/IARS, ileS; isoleucyl-tRNA synthetase